MQTVLLHSCCAPCSCAIVEWLLNNNIRPTLFYFNPNIWPREEYDTRKAECSRFAHQQGIEIIDGDYDHPAWLAQMAGLEHEPERGDRCLICFKRRMFATAQLAHARRFSQFATTLASSRWKSLAQLSKAGKWAATQFPEVEFWDKNWRKDGLSERRKILIAEHRFYNQRYCGCEFSIPPPL